MQEEIIEVSIQNLIIDVQGRVNKGSSELERSIRQYGQLSPLTVQGPDAQGKYYVLDGCRRVQIMKDDLNWSATVKCISIGAVSSQKERNNIRFRLLSPSKKPIGVEFQFMLEQAQQDPELIQTLPKQKRKKIERGIEIPKNLRLRLSKKRGSQEALAVIWHDLNCELSYRDELINRLLNTDSITGDHAVALKKLVSQPFYSRLNHIQQKFAIEATLSRAKFSDYDAELFIIQAMMQTQPSKDFADFWMLYIGHEIELLADKIHTEISALMSPSVREFIIEVRAALDSQLDGILAREKDKTEQTVDEHQPETVRHTPENEIKKSLIDAALTSAHLLFHKSRKVVVPTFEHNGNTIRVIFPEKR